MTSNFPSTRQWTIRSYPWFTIFGAFILIATFFWAWSAELLNPISILVLLVILVVLAIFSEYATCQIDLDQRLISLHRTRILRMAHHEIPFSNLLAVSLEESRNNAGDNPSTTYRILFVLKSGEIIPMSSIGSSLKSGKPQRVQAITDYINQVQFPRIYAALDGIVRVLREGQTYGLNWQMEFVIHNDHSPVTRWRARAGVAINGFLLVMPARGAPGKAMPTGFFGSAVRMVYSQYLQLIDINPINLPGFDQAELLPGEQAGLGKNYIVFTSDVTGARNWLVNQHAVQFLQWVQANPAYAKKGDPHLIVTQQEIQLLFNANLNQDAQIAIISQLGGLLTR